tara:strand:+ start:1319 stop:2323 length:1005 start_codon:yes stop_codon:yes gene_type:complete
MKIKNGIDWLNTLLVILCGVLAYFFPLKVFILSFAVLGPLHYLTEINWLSSNNYFTPFSKKLGLSIAIIASIIVVFPRLYFQFVDLESTNTISAFLLAVNSYSNGAIFTCFLLAIGVHFIKQPKEWIIIILLSLGGSYFLNTYETYAVLIGVLVPTIIHVYLFTLLFMLYGARKNRSKPGFLSIGLAVIVPLIFIVIPVDSSSYFFSDFFKSTLIDNNLHHTPVLFSKFIGLSDGTSFYFYEQLELRLMMFISFIYLYHYLNWFSKTTTIFWHKSLTIKRTIYIGSFWAVLLFLFFYDFKVGFLVALFFSFLHVILEFPLNIASIKSLFIKLTN